jgi:hypothetical protein
MEFADTASPLKNAKNAKNGEKRRKSMKIADNNCSQADKW